jgi:hypothetical protein
VMEWYPVERDLKFMRDWVDWLTEVCKRYWYVDEFGKVTWDTVSRKFMVMKQWLEDNKKGDKVSIKNTIHTFLNPDRSTWKQNK